MGQPGALLRPVGPARRAAALRGGGGLSARRRRVARLSVPLVGVLLAGACAGPASDRAPAEASRGPPPATPAVAAEQALPAPAELPWPEESPALLKGLWVGTWSPAGDEGFGQAWLDEEGLRQVYTRERAGRRSWAGVQGAAPPFPIDELARDRDGPAVAYVYSLLSRTRIEQPLAEDAYPDAPAVLFLRHRGRIQVRVDGVLVVDAPAPPAGTWGEVRAPFTMTAPYDVFLLKCGRGSPGLGEGMAFELRVSTPWGEPVPGQHWNSMRPPGLPSDLPAAGAP